MRGAAAPIDRQVGREGAGFGAMTITENSRTC